MGPWVQQLICWSSPGSIHHVMLRDYRSRHDPRYQTVSCCSHLLHFQPYKSFGCLVPCYCRQVGIRSLEPVGVFLPGDQNYPGGTPFDPLGFSRKPDEFVEQAVKEIKNGRLAMLAMLGYFVQAVVTHQGPVQNLLSFAADPLHNNIVGFVTGSAAH